MLTLLLRQSLVKPWLLIAPIVIAVAAVGFVISALLFWSAVQVDDATASREKNILMGAVHRSVLRIGKDQEASTVWDDAVEHVISPDAEWLDANLGIWMHSYYGHDETFVLDAHDQPIYAMIGGKRAAPESYSSARPAIPSLVRELRQKMANGAAPEGSDTQTPGVQDLAVVGGHPAIVSVKPIVSDTGKIEQAPGTEGIHVSIRYLDGDFTSRLATNYQLKDARFSWQDDEKPDQAAFPFAARDGSVLGYLIWSPYEPGSSVRKSLQPALAAALLGITIIIGILVIALRQGASALARSEALARHLAEHDPLTNLPNRVLFSQRLQALFVETRRTKAELALLALDLDRFKQVNDTLGHAAGDQLLRQVGTRLSRAVRSADLVARLGGDEFSIILPGADEKLVNTVCRRLLLVVQDPFEILGHTVSIGVSIGIAFASADAAESERLVHRADLALYSAKRLGGGRHVRYSETLEGLLTPRVARAARLEVPPIPARA